MKVVYPMLSIDAVDTVWPSVYPLLKNTADTHLDVDDVYYRLENGDWTLWISKVEGIIVSAAVTSFIHYPKYTAFRIILCAGSGTNWADATEYLEEVAKHNGCEALEVLGRKGWERALRSRGFEFQNITLNKRL